MGAEEPDPSVVLLVATFGGIYICYLLALPFLSALTWALVPGGLVRLGSPGNRGQTEKVQPLSYDLGADGGADCRRAGDLRCRASHQ